VRTLAGAGLYFRLRSYVRLYLHAFVGCLLCVPVAFGQRPTEVIKGKSAVAREVLVKFRTASAAAVADVEQAADTEHSERVGRGDALRLIRSRSKNVDKLVNELAARPDVEYVEPNYIINVDAIPSDPSFSALWGLNNTGQIGGLPGADIEAPAAWDLTRGSASLAVGVIDSGIDYTHPDLSPNVWSAPAAFTVTLGGRTLTCPAGSHGFNALAFTCDPYDDFGHGTHVAGIIGAAGNNGLGVTGVNWTTRMVAIKFLDATGTGTTAGAVNGIYFLIQANSAFANTATPLNVRVLSASWGGPGASQALLDAINWANAYNMLFVAAAGNSGVNTDISPNFPSNYGSPNVISVAATDSADRRASFSNYGASTVDLGAPGVNILSTTRGGGYGYMSGTSMATPHVSGVAALALANCKLDTVALRDLLLRTAEPVAALAGITATGGRLNALRALRGCSSSPSFAVSATPAALSVARGTAATYSVTVTPQSGFTGAATLSVTGVPSGVTAGFGTNPVSITSAAAASSSLSLFVGATAVAGTYPLTVTATSGSLTQTTAITLTITASASGFSLTAAPGSQSVTAGNAVNYSVTLTPDPGSSNSVTLAVSGLPAGAMAGFSANPVAVSAPASSTLTITTATNTPAGTYMLTVTGTSGSISRTAVVSLPVTALAQTTTVPAVPVNVQAMQLSPTQNRITWSPGSTNQNGFILEACQGVGCNFTSVWYSFYGAGVTEAVHSGVAPGQVWSYHVRAYNDVGSSTYSAITTVADR
jgi:subtilisin family serine protease